MAKSDVELAKVIQEFFDPECACDETALALAAAEVLAGELVDLSKSVWDNIEDGLTPEQDEPEDVDLSQLANSKVIAAIDTAQVHAKEVYEKSGVVDAVEPDCEPLTANSTIEDVRRVAGCAYDALESLAIDKLERELGNMGVALGLVEGQRDGLLGVLEGLLQVCSDACSEPDGSFIVGVAISKALPDVREAIAKCEAGS